MTVGTVVPIRNAARPGDGSVCSACESITVPVDAVDVSMTGVSPRNRHRLRERADFERHVEREELLRADADGGQA